MMKMIQPKWDKRWSKLKRLKRIIGFTAVVLILIVLVGVIANVYEYRKSVERAETEKLSRIAQLETANKEMKKKVEEKQEEIERLQERLRLMEIRNLFPESEMVFVKGGTFLMGRTSEHGDDDYADEDSAHIMVADFYDENPAHCATLGDFYIGKYEVTQAQWKAVMGDSSFYFTGDSLPAEGVYLEEAKEFLSRLNAATGKDYRLPSEQEWEYAARGGNKSRRYKYSGSNRIGDVAWYSGNTLVIDSASRHDGFPMGGQTHPVGGKKANELGIYDMSGNVSELCDAYLIFYPSGPVMTMGRYSVYRGGCWYYSAGAARVSAREYGNPVNCAGVRGFRLVLDVADKKSATLHKHKPAKKTNAVIKPEMVFVEGGTFVMGCTAEQGDDCANNENPAHEVTLNDFYIGKYEVTQEQWKSLMADDLSFYTCGREHPDYSYFKGSVNLPVETVCWDAVEKFIDSLNRRTGQNYRLPTEAEWEYAARGGNKSHGYKYSGSNDLDTVAWYKNNSAGKTHPAGSKKANELGIYDMSGNVWELCSDWYDDYPSKAKKNPKGPSDGDSHVRRGGCWNNEKHTRVTMRGYCPPNYYNGDTGFRLAMSVKK